MGRILEYTLILYLIYTFIIKPLMKISNNLRDISEQRKPSKPNKKEHKNGEYIDYEELK